jgi:hypothetical protein
VAHFQLATYNSVLVVILYLKFCTLFPFSDAIWLAIGMEGGLYKDFFKMGSIPLLGITTIISKMVSDR